ncbi:MAG: hypothetical protein QM703_29415 [Gemmatales bacterium]
MLIESWLSWFKRPKAITFRAPKIRRKPRSLLLSQDWLLEDRLVLSSSILGNELLVNTSLVGKQAFDVSNDRSMDVTSDGTAIVAWADSTKGIVGQRIGEDGTKLGTEFVIGGATDTNRGNANVAVYRKANSNETDKFVVTWTSTGNGGDNSGSGVFARVFAIDGTPLTDAFRVNSSTTGDQKDSSVEWIAANRFVIAWSGAGQGESQTVFVKIFDDLGRAGSTEIRVPETKTGVKKQPAVISLPNGGFQIAWSGNGPGDENGIFSRQFTSTGVKVGATEFRVNEVLNGLTHSQPTMTRSATQVVIAWQVTDTTGSPYGTGILARRFGLDGKPLATRFIVNETTIGNQSNPSIAMMNDGGFAIAWRSVQSGDGIYQREYNSDGTPRFGERLVNSTLDGTQTNPTIRSQGPDGYVVVWDGKIGSVAQGIGMQRYGDPFMPTITSDNKYVDGFNEVLYLKPNVPTDPVIPMKTFTLYNSSNLTIYPILEDANSSAAKDKVTGLYDPYDPLNQEYRGYIGYKDPATGKFYLGLRPGETFTFSVPLVFWDAGRMHITTDAQYLITPTGVANPFPNPFKYYDIDPYSGKQTKRFMEDTSIDGSMGRIMWYHARAKTSGDAEQIGLDAPTQLTEFTIRDPIMGDTNYKTHDEIATSEKQTLINYDVSYVDSIVLPVAMETTDVQPFPPQKYSGSISTNVLTLSTDLSKLLFKGMLVTSAAGALPAGTTIESVDATTMPGKTIVTLSKNANTNPLPPASSDYFFTHPTPTAAFGWTGAAQRFETLQAAIKQFTLPNTAGKNNNGLGLYFADQNNPNGNGYPQFYNPDSVLSGIKLPSGQNLPGLSPFKAAEGNTGPKSSYNNSRFMITSGGTTDSSLPLGGNAGPYAPPQSPQDANAKQLWINFPLGQSLEECQAIAAQLDAGKSDWTIRAKLGGDPDITLKGKVTAVGKVFLYAGAYRLVVTLDQANGLDGGVGYGFTFIRTVSDYASTKLANIWYSWAKHYVDAVTKSFGQGYTKNITGTISEDSADKKPTNLITVAGDLTKTLAPGMVITSQTGMIFPEATADDPNVRVTILDLKYDGTSTIISLSKRPIGRNNGDALSFTVALPVMLTPADKGVTTFDIAYSKEAKFAKDAAEAEKFGQSVYQLMEAMNTIPLFKDQGPDWLQVLTNCIGGNIGFIKNIGVESGDKKYITTGYHGIANEIRTLIKSVLRGVSDFSLVPESSGRWYPDPSLTGSKTGQLINTGSGFKSATYNILNLDPFVWFVHKQLGLSGYGFSLDDDVADVGAPGATKLSLDVGGIDKLPQQAEWTWGTTFGPVNATQGQIETVTGGEFTGNKMITHLGTTVLPPTSDPINVGLLVHGGDPDVGPGALVFGPGIPLGTRVALPIPSENSVILDTKVPPDTAQTGPFNFRGTLPLVTASAVTNKTTTLRVATDGLYGESNWTYTWSMVDGPNGATVSFTPNKTNAARKSTATFSASGTYLIRVTITNPSDKSSITNDITIKV